jgi:hypothetical protein
MRSGGRPEPTTSQSVSAATASLAAVLSPASLDRTGMFSWMVNAVASGDVHTAAPPSRLPAISQPVGPPAIRLTLTWAGPP